MTDPAPVPNFVRPRRASRKPLTRMIRAPRTPMARLARTVLIGLAMVAVSIRPAAAQQVLRDAETEAFFADISEPLIRAAKLDPANVKVILLNDSSINAFVAGGQIVYLHSGLIAAATSANEVQGVIAHELGHIEGGHVIRSGEGTKPATGIMILSLLLGAAAAAAGAGDAGMGILMAGQQAAMGKYLAFSRVQESVADASGARYLSAAGITGKGSISFFKKLQNYEFRLGISQDGGGFDRTHPLSGDRIQTLEDTYRADPAWDRPPDAGLQARFERVKAKLAGYINEPPQTLRDYPETKHSIPARYARAYAWHKAAYPDKAAAEAQSLIDESPHDPYFLELYGQIQLESGNPIGAIASLREATRLTGNAPLIAATFGHALIATEDAANFAEATRVLKAAVSRDNENPFAWYQLGVVYAQEGDQPRAALATAERYLMEGTPQLALPNAITAMAGLKEGTPDWLRAQDIRLIAEADVEKLRKGKHRTGLYMSGPTGTRGLQ